MADKETGNNDDLMKEFAEFLEAKRASEQEKNEAEDFDVEIWDEKGRGVRTRRSHAKPFLNSLGIDVDPPAGDGSNGSDDQTKGTKKPPAKTRTSTGPESTVRKYFTPKK